MGAQPPNFSWVLPGRLAGLALPRLPAHYQFLLEQGVRHLVSLTERGPPHGDSCPGLTLHRLRIPDFCPPAPEQIDRFVRIVDEANARGEVSGQGGACRPRGGLGGAYEGRGRAQNACKGRRDAGLWRAGRGWSGTGRGQGGAGQGGAYRGQRGTTSGVGWGTGRSPRGTGRGRAGRDFAWLWEQTGHPGARTCRQGRGLQRRRRVDPLGRHAGGRQRLVSALQSHT